MTTARDSRTATSLIYSHAVAIHVMKCNFVRIRKTLRFTPAMAAGVTDKFPELSDMVKVLEDWEAARERDVHGLA
jgi:hypothetical protein